MSSIFYRAAMLAGVGLVLVSGFNTADARRWRTIERCLPAVEGIPTGQGLFGKGTARARSMARESWEDEAARQYGPEFARFRFARDVAWDCKKGAVIRAKCVVGARPCRPRIRG